MFILGIDPDKGWALVQTEPKKKVVEAGTVDGMEELITFLIHNSSGSGFLKNNNCIVRVEKPRTTKVARRPGVSDKAMVKIGRNVGQNNQKAEEIERICRLFLNLKTEFTHPCIPKPTTEQIEAVTKFNKTVSQHARDAIAIAWR